MRDFLDEYVDERAIGDPEFALLLAEARERLSLSGGRTEAHLTQAQVAERMGVPQPRVAEIERHPDRVSFGRIKKYVRALGGRITIETASGERIVIG